MKFMSFDCVVRWGTVAWIAETVTKDNWYISQGRTPSEALASLKDAITTYAIFNVRHGYEPFHHSSPTPNEAIVRFDKQLRLAKPLKDSNRASKEKAYWSNLKIRWVKK